jgi:hypothetical protein
MSADNGIYILQSKDGYRITHAQAIENLYWDEDQRCEVQQLQPKKLERYFGKCKVFKTRREALKEADRLYQDIIKNCGICEYGISFISGWENRRFPIRKTMLSKDFVFHKEGTTVFI